MIDAVEVYRWLVSYRAESLLVRVAADVRKNPATPAQIRTLRSEVGVERTALLLEQVELRRRAREKFPEADRLFFTRRGLEQATDSRLARYKAGKFAEWGDLADLCCGIGGDAMTLALDHLIRLVDRDEAALILAVANIARLGGAEVHAVCASVAPDHVADINVWHLDPDRRAGGQRTSRAEFAEPGLELIEQLRTANPHGAIKLAPAAEVPESWRNEGEREWIETRSECRQQMIWLGDLAEHPGSAIATIVEDDSGEAALFRGLPEVPLPSGDAVGKYVFDPSPALAAAHLTGALAEALELTALTSQSLYLTSDRAVLHPLLQTFEVQAELPVDIRQLRAYFREHGIGRLEIKKRGIEIKPESLRPQLDLRGDGEATLLLACVADRKSAIICRRVA